MKLKISWEQFVNEVESYRNEANGLIAVTIPEDIEGVEAYAHSVRDWEGRFLSFWRDSIEFTVRYQEHSFPLREWKPEKSDLVHKNKVSEVAVKYKNRLGQHLKNLEFFMPLISVCDTLIRPNDAVLIESRSKMGIGETIELLLVKLNLIYNSRAYPIETVLNGNGVNTSRTEAYNLGRHLISTGWCKEGQSNPDWVQLTVEGRLRAEELMRAKQADYSKIPDDAEQLTDVLAEIRHKLDMIGCGQEILFDDLEELRELYGKLSKRSWGQLLKSKAVDWVAEKVVDKSVVSWIYDQLTKTELRLPSEL